MQNILKTSKLFLSSLLLVAFFAACDKVEEPYKKTAVVVDTIGVLTGTTTSDTVDKKVVLLEDYTGHTCVNCPKAHVKAHELMQKYGKQLVVITVHQGTFALPEASGKFTYDFRVLPTVDEWNAVWGITGYPAGLINRTKFNGNFVCTYSSWDGRIEPFTLQAPDAIINIKNYFNASSNKFTSRIKTKFTNALTGNYKIFACVIEDSIIKPQKNNDPLIGTVPDIDNYVHMHVLRGVLNSTWGESIGTNSIAAGTIIEKIYPVTLKADWNEEHMSVVAFIYDAADYHVIQAAVAPLDSW
jgi:thiol-disulfide isomerase/thioredoxin